MKTEVLKQKEDFSKGNKIVALSINDSVNIVSDSLVSDSTAITHDEDVLGKILPKRGRIKRQNHPQFVQNFSKKSAKTITRITSSSMDKKLKTNRKRST